MGAGGLPQSEERQKKVQASEFNEYGLGGDP